MPCKNFFLSSLAPTCSFTSYPSYPLPLSICSTGMLLNCNTPSTTSMLLNCNHLSITSILLNCNSLSSTGMSLNYQLGFPLQVLWTTSTSLNYYPESRDMPSGHVHSTPGTCDMPSGHMPPSPTSHETDNMPSSYLASPRMSGCTTLTCTVPLTITFPGCLPYEREAYTRHPLPLEEEEHMQDSHMYIMDLKDPCDYPSSPASHDIHEATPTDNPSCLPYERRAYTQDNLGTSLMEGRHPQDRYPNRSSLLERQHTQIDLDPYDSFLDDSSPDSYLLLDDSFAWLMCFL